MRNDVRGLFLAVSILACTSPALFGQASGRLAETTRPLDTAPERELSVPELWVSGFSSDAIHRYDQATGAYLSNHTPVPGAQSIHRGPDRLLYVCAEKTDQVLRFLRGRYVDAFVWDDPLTPQNETGGLDGPTAAVFGPDGNLYVASFNDDRVLRYDGATGQFMNVFVAPSSGGLDGPDAGMVFGPDGHLYVPSFNSNRVVRYDGTTGLLIDVFIRAQSGLRNPRMLCFRPNGDLLVSSWGTDEILRYDSTGALLGTFLTFRDPTGFAFSPHDGDIYVTSDRSDKVVRFDGTSGVRIGLVIPSGAGGLSGATYLEFIGP